MRLNNLFKATANEKGDQDVHLEFLASSPVMVSCFT
jgi:hypothetical protein